MKLLCNRSLTTTRPLWEYLPTGVSGFRGHANLDHAKVMYLIEQLTGSKELKSNYSFYELSYEVSPGRLFVLLFYPARNHQALALDWRSNLHPAACGHRMSVNPALHT